MKKPKRPRPKQLDMFPPAETPEEAKAVGMRRALDNEKAIWRSKALQVALEEISKHDGQAISGEKLRHLVYPRVGKPHHPNVWGAMVNVILRKNALLPTGRTVAPQDVASHACPKPEYICKAI